MSNQTVFASALLNPDLPCPPGLRTWNGSDPATRFAVYRNNVVVSLIDALADTYPVVQALVGEEFFRAMAGVFARAHPPRSRVMAYYGDSFAEFIAAFAPAASVPYLADVARLEMARVLAYHAADAVPVATDALHAALVDPQQLETLRLVLHPSVQVITSEFAVLSIWAEHQTATSAPPLDPDVAQTVLVYRNALTVDSRELATGAAVFVTVLQSGHSLLDAADAASSNDSDFDLTPTLALLLHLQLITQTTIESP